MDNPDRAATKRGEAPAKGGGGQRVACALVCAVCVAFCVYNGWREQELRSRVGRLEDRLRVLEEAAPGGWGEVEHRRLRRVAREADEEEEVRATREAPECVCPAGGWRSASQVSIFESP